ncbi:hypothetical protein Tco_0324966 [Tanacetum coccineum]
MMVAAGLGMMTKVIWWSEDDVWQGGVEREKVTLQPARNPLCLCGICVSIDDRDDCNTSSSTFVPYGVYNLLTISHQQNHQGFNYFAYTLQSLQPARNPLRLCGICVSIDDHDNCNTSSSTSVPYGVSNLSTISHQQNHQATNSDIEHPESRPKTVNTSTFLNQALKTADAVLPTSYEAFESLIQIEKLYDHFIDSGAASAGNIAIAIGPKVTKRTNDAKKSR